MTKAEARQLWQIQGKGSACATALALFLKSKAKHKPISSRKIEKKALLIKKGLACKAVRLACELRAGGRCECCGTPFVPASDHEAEMDHFYSRAFSESVETCWMLTRACHRSKTQNWPDRAVWDEHFKMHCRINHYPFRPRLTKDLGRRGSRAIPPAALKNTAAVSDSESK